jgi:cytochrome c-type biogenesis protein CcsB
MSDTPLFLNDLNYYFIATFIYVLAAVAYGINFFFKDRLKRISRILAVLGLIIHSTGMAIRWIRAAEPILTSLFEMILWFAWGAIIVMLIVEIRFRYKPFGFFVLPFVIIIMGIILLMPWRSAGATMPALQSVWLYIHVAVAIVSYAAFLVGFSAAIMYFIKKDLSRNWFAFSASFYTTAVLLMINRLELITKQTFNVYVRTPRGIEIADSFNGVGTVLFLAFILSVVSSVLYILELSNKNREKDLLSKIAQPVFMLAVIANILGTANLIIKLTSHDRLKITSQPAETAFLLSSVIISLFCLMFVVKYRSFQEKIPREELLDSIQYYTVTVGFPFLTLTIITGAIWANKAWGSYWGNDPKELAAAVTWLVYAAYLHMRITRGWKGVKAAVILALGFVAVMFTLIGVTYLAPGGLHSYI